MSRPLLHAPACGIRVAPSLGVSIVVDPGPDEKTRRRRLALDTWATVVTVVAVTFAVVTAPMAVAAGHTWVPVVLLIVATIARHTRPPRRTLPPVLAEHLGWLDSIDRSDRALAHRLVWRACVEASTVGSPYRSARASSQTVEP